MKKIYLLLVCVIVFYACNSKKTDTMTETSDSLAVDSMVQAENLAPASLAFTALPGYEASKGNTSTDVNFLWLLSQEDLDKNFTLTNSGTDSSKPDFIINNIIGVVGAPSPNATTISVDKVEVELGRTINVYVTITSGEKTTTSTTPAAVFAIEKRDGTMAIQFFVNGKKGQEILLI